MSSTNRRKPRPKKARSSSPDGGPSKSHEGERLVDEVEATRDHLRDAARAAMGVTGEEKIAPLRDVVNRSGVGFYPMLAIGLLLVVSEFQSYGFLVLGPEIGRALGMNKTAIAGVLLLKTLAVSVAALPMAAYVQRNPRRGALAIATGFGWATMTLFTGFATSSWILALVLVADGASTASVQAIHPPLLMDTYPTEARLRVLSAYRGAREAGQIVAPLTVGLLVGVFGFTWRGVFLITGVLCLGVAVFSIRLRDPGFGKWDAARVREIVRAQSGHQAEPIAGEHGVELGFFEIVRRILKIPTVYRVLTAFAVFGMLLAPLITYFAFFLEIRWGLGPGWRGVFFAGVAAAALPALGIFGRRGEALFRSDPSRLVHVVSMLLLVGVALLAIAVTMPVLPLVFLFFAGAAVCLTCMGPGLSMMLLGLVAPRMRPHAAALSGIFLAGVGGFAGLLLLGGIDRRFGTTGAIIALIVPGVGASLLLRGASKLIGPDLDRLAGDLVEEEELSLLSAQGARLPMLVCRRIDFSYGQLQVLFDVDFTVDDGEMVALLGTNGAGKSTLLRVIAGVGIPDRGSVRYQGTDVTYVDAERRVSLGILQVPSGRSVFGPLSVVDNLLVFGSLLGRDRKAVERGIEATFDAFPKLAERRNQPASTLSGGEQQMLGLGRALMLRPRLLLIDELSLGLAPAIVEGLLDMVRRINAEGTSIVLVEQSVNIALSLVEHAYFMEKGEIRFDGRANDLLTRRDLLRSVFLGGAARGLT